MRNLLIAILLVAAIYAGYHEVRRLINRPKPASSSTATATDQPPPASRMSPGLAFDSSSSLGRPLAVAPPSPADTLQVSRWRPTPIAPMTSMVLTDSMGVALGDPDVPAWLKQDPGPGIAFMGPGRHVTTTAFTAAGFASITVGIDGKGIRCIAVFRRQQMEQASDSLTSLFGLAPSQRLDHGMDEERVWWGADSRVSLWSKNTRRMRGVLGVSVMMVALRSDERLDTLTGPRC